MRYASWTLVATLWGIAGGCTGPAGQDGQPGANGEAGPGGDAGPPGEAGTTGDAGHNAYITGPGVTLTITDTTIAGTVAAVTFTIADSAGLPLDKDGLYTAGPVTLRFALGWLDEDASGNPGQYTAYTTRTQTSPITGVTETQASTDSGGTFVELAPGEYTYTLATPVTVADPARTHTVGAYATRDFEGQRYVANTVFHFLPSGGAVTVTREVVQTSACNNCHNPLEAHGGARRDTQLCILCHQPQTIDPDTGNTVDMPVMIHKIHRGHDLPSVLAGTPYQIIGFSQTVFDFSTVAFPRDLRNCDTCHQGAQADYWDTRPSRAVCGSCHDLITWVDPPPAGMTLHSGGAMADDTMCTTCHPSSGGLAGVRDRHLLQVPYRNPANLVIGLSIVSVTNTAPGMTPEIVFSVTEDGVPRDILTSPLTVLTVTVAGPTTDYASYAQYRIQGTGAVGTLSASGTDFRYVLPATGAMSATATGSYAFGLEGYVQAVATDPRRSAFNPVAYAAVTDAVAVPRRQVVEAANCNNCHLELAEHGGQRKNPEYCILCHTANFTNSTRVARFENSTIDAQSVHFDVMIHKIHMGERLSQQPYVLGGFPAPNAANPAGTPIDFGEVRFPGQQQACWTCHVADSYTLPLPSGALPSRVDTMTCTEAVGADADSYCTTPSWVIASSRYIPPESAACTACHDSPAVVAHAEIMTSPSGIESCATCHGPGASFDVTVVHALAP